MRGGTVGCNHFSETDSQKPVGTRQAKRAHCKIVRIGKNLDSDRGLQFHAVSGAQSVFGSLQQLQYVRTVDRRFSGVHPNTKSVCFQRRKLCQFVPQLNEIENVNVVSIVFQCRFAQLPPFVFFSQSQQILSQLHSGRLVAGCECECESLMLGSFRKTILLRQFASDQMVDSRIFRPWRECPIAKIDFTFGVIAQMCHHRIQGPRERMGGIGFEYLIEQCSRVAVLFGIDIAFGLGEQCRKMSRIQPEGFGEMMGGQGRLRYFDRPCETKMHIRVTGMSFESLFKRLCGQGKILFGNCQFAAGKESSAMGGSDLECPIKKEFEDLTRIFTLCDGDFAKCHKTFRVAVIAPV